LALVGSGEADCDGEEVKRCWMATLNTEVLEEAGMVLPGGQKMVVEAREGHTVIYVGDNMAKAVLTHRGGKLYGTVSLGFEQFRLGCKGEGKVMWSMLDGDHWGEGDPLEEEELEEPGMPHLEEKRMGELMALGKMDRNSLVEYTVTVYYTRTLARETHDLPTFIDQVIAETNEGYRNSGINLRVRVHCLLESKIPDGLDNKQSVRLLRHSEPTNNLVRHSADTAILLVKSFSKRNSCGVAYFNGMVTGRTFGTVRKGCALGYFSFGHELAHTFGLAHDRRVSRRSSRKYAYGNVIETGKTRTIMAYSTRAREVRVNYYSSPYVKLPNGKYTGNHQANNAQRLTEVRYLAAAIGNEAMTCHGDIKNRDINKTTWDADDIKMGINDINSEVDDTNRDTDRNSNDIKWEGSTISREVNHTDSKNKMKYFDNTDMKIEAFDSNSIEEADDEMNNDRVNNDIADSQKTTDNGDNREITNQIVVDREIGVHNDGSKTIHTGNSDWEVTDKKMGRKGTMEKSGMDFTSTGKVTTNIADMNGEMHNRKLDNYDYEREITNQIVVD